MFTHISGFIILRSWWIRKENEINDKFNWEGKIIQNEVTPFSIWTKSWALHAMDRNHKYAKHKYKNTKSLAWANNKLSSHRKLGNILLKT